MVDFNLLKKYFEQYIEDTYIKIKKKYLISDDEESLKVFNVHNKMVKQKYDHTMRVVENISKVAEKMEQSVNFLELTKTVALLHDIGRFEQAIYSDSYVDSIVYKNHPTLKNHAEEGELFLNETGFKIFSTPQIYQPAISKSVGLHQVNELPKEFNHKVDIHFGKIEPDNILTGSYKFNEYEQKIISLLLQMVRDVDKIDILYQRANGEIKAIPSIIYVKNADKASILYNWGITYSDLKELNSEYDINNSDSIMVDTKKIPIEKLFIKDDIKNMIYSGEKINLKELQSRSDYSFITAVWWSIYTFLSDINFVSNLEVIEDNELLKQIYNRYPESYRPLIDEIFNYAKDKLISERIYLNKNNLYVNKGRK